MATDELLDKIARVVANSLAGVSLAAEQLDEFARRLARSYLDLVTLRNLASFGQMQQVPMERMIGAGVPVERIITAVEKAGVLVAATLPNERGAVGLANAVAKMVAAQAYIQTVKRLTP